MKIASWNVNSVRARTTHLIDWLGRVQPDVVCLQELKGTEDVFPLAEVQAAGYSAAIVGQKAYNGVAVLSKKPATVIGTSLGDEQARYIEVDYEGVRIIGIYAPNGNPIDTDKFTFKLDWLERLYARMQALLIEEVPFIVTGDFNIIPEPVDASDPAAWVNDALFQPESRAMYRRFLNLGLSDALRMHHPRDAMYTFWDYQAGSWQRDNGIRIDHALLSPQLADRCVGFTVDREERAKETPSDHVPVITHLS